MGNVESSPYLDYQDFITSCPGDGTQAVLKYLCHCSARPHGVSLIDWHKERLGPHTDCQVFGRRRFWIWRLTPDGIVMVNSKKGICIEVLRGMTAARVDEIADLYYEKMGTSGRKVQ